jgi:hypothetical protein
MSPNLVSMPLNSTSAIVPSETVNDYDYEGAVVYIAVVLIWYSAGLLLMLFFRIRPRSFENEFSFDYETKGKSTSSTTNPFAKYHDIQADNTKKQILNELKDPENRKRLWKIYFSLPEKQNEQHPQYYQTITADNVTIDRINRKLADIHRMGAREDDDDNDDVVPSIVIQSPNDNRFDAPKSFAKRFAPRRSSHVSVNTRRPIFRVQSQPDTPSATSTAEPAPFVYENQPTSQSINDSRKRNNKFLNRFTIEKVVEKIPL